MSKFYLIIMTIFVSLSLFGETFECVYIEGNADYFQNGEWVYLDFGIELEPGSRIKLDDFSIVQFESAQTTLFFSRKGEYTLTQSIQLKDSNNQLANLTRKMGALLSEKNSQSTVAMGIRGDEAEFNDDLGFKSTSIKDLEAAWNSIESGEYEEAERELELLYDMSADPFSEGQLLFTLAYAEEMQGKTGQAWGHLGDIIMPELGDYYPSYLLLAGQISFKGRNFVEAASSFRTFLEINPYNEAAGEVRELLLFCEEQI